MARITWVALCIMAQRHMQSQLAILDVKGVVATSRGLVLCVVHNLNDTSKNRVHILGQYDLKRIVGCF